jgi:hypothetical protein
MHLVILSVTSFMYLTHRKVVGSRPDGANAFFPIYLILPATLGPWVHSAFNGNEYQKQKNNVLEGRVQPVHRADNLTTICGPIV